MKWKCKLGMHKKKETGPEFFDAVICENCDAEWEHTYDFRSLGLRRVK